MASTSAGSDAVECGVVEVAHPWNGANSALPRILKKFDPHF